MPVPSEIDACLTLKVAAMTPQERAERAAEMIDLRSPRKEENLEFAKLMCGPNAGAQDIMDLILRNGRGRTMPDNNDMCYTPS